MSWHRKLPNQAACSNCCGIKEKLQTLWDRTINSILRINQVEPDDQGNIRIRSDSEALTVSEGTNEIVLNLDTSELPAAAVLSVNGETGAVQLDGSDIPSLYNGTVDSNIYGLWQTKADRTQLTTETTNRRNADTALQNNINTLQASIPQEAADAVAADPTVQSFAAAAAAIPDKVDKRTGAGLRAYTHTGSTQDDTVVEDSTNGATIPIRDANGRLHAADPAAGATDKTLTTANWVSQTGDNAPNNLVHRRGNETIYNDKLFDSPVKVKYFLANRFSITPQNGKYWIKVYTYNNTSRFAVPSFAFTAVTREHSDLVIATVQLNQLSGTVQSVTLKGIATDNNIKQLFAVSSESADEFTLWFNCDFWQGGLRANLNFSLASNYAVDNVTSINPTGNPQQAYDISQSGYTDENGVTHTFVAYAVMA